MSSNSQVMSKDALVPAPSRFAGEPPAIAQSLAVQRAPEIVLEEAHKAAAVLKKVVDSKPKKIVLGGKTYLNYEDWLTVARFYGVTVGTKSTRYVEFGKVKGFESTAEALLVSTGTAVSSAESLCLDDEPNWQKKPLFQLKSMAQTRACAKALRNVFAWVVVLAGYAATPVEESTRYDEEGEVSDPPRKPAQKGGKKVSQTVIDKRLKQIAQSKTMDDLKTVGASISKTTYQQAKTLGDVDTIKLLAAAFNTRKQQIEDAQAVNQQPAREPGEDEQEFGESLELND